MTINYYCPECESDQVFLNARMSWDVQAQTWVMHSTTGIAICESCQAVLRELIPLEVIVWTETNE